MRSRSYTRGSPVSPTGDPLDHGCRQQQFEQGVPISSDFISAKQLAHQLNMSPSWVYREAARLGLPSYRFGSGRSAKIQFKVSEVNAWIRQHRQTT
ncbi:helix-turn-helix transcriptional regulator [Streptomyces sp. XY66]|uniref:helix-turn-helix transcriptional regulator n=1 Tax=Streptomyces sp. XY66 TaxID=1415563 RepID=UPI003B63D2C1